VRRVSATPVVSAKDARTPLLGVRNWRKKAAAGGFLRFTLPFFSSDKELG
jgi:hypothetical protein